MCYQLASPCVANATSCCVKIYKLDQLWCSEYLSTVSAPQKKYIGLVQEADFLDISQTRENMAVNDNRYVWSKEETEVFLDLIQRT